jgi:hypothetical protein
MLLLTAQLSAQLGESRQLEAQLSRQLKGLGYDI